MNNNAQSYWRANIRLVLSLLAFWFIFSFGCGILFVDALDTIRIGGFKLGFWFAQQGSIFVFVVLIFVYIRQMDKLDDKYKTGASRRDTDPSPASSSSPAPTQEESE